jgi:nucleotide-binding universal stress UspA family protein
MKLLLPVDGSECSIKTLEWATKVFNTKTTEYYLLSAIPVLPDLNTVEYQIVDTLALLKKARFELELKGCKVIKAEYILGDPVNQICQYADEMAIDHVVIGSHVRTGLSKLLMGSTSEAVLEHCKCPVVVYRPVVNDHEAERKHVPHLISSNTVL